MEGPALGYFLWFVGGHSLTYFSHPWDQVPDRDNLSVTSFTFNDPQSSAYGHSSIFAPVGQQNITEAGVCVRNLMADRKRKLEG